MSVFLLAATWKEFLVKANKINVSLFSGYFLAENLKTSKITCCSGLKYLYINYYLTFPGFSRIFKAAWSNFGSEILEKSIFYYF